jgi:ectoine hydroxylase-related dioxygenase (phytanoyl-CoA dioxygenase family)
MARITRRTADDPLDEIVATLCEEGAVIVEGTIPAAVLDRCNAELDPLLATAAADHDGGFVNPLIAAFFGTCTRHVTAVAARSRAFATDIMTNPVLLGAAQTVLGPNCSGIQLNLGHVIDRGPGAVRQPLHRDELVWAHLPVPHPEVQVASMIALSEFTGENGATLVVPGSHRWDRDRRAEPDEIVAAAMPAGSAVLYLGSTLHAAGDNTTEDTWRRGLHLSYTLGWLRTEENHSLSIPLEVARTLPRESQALLGFGAHDAIGIGGGYLGMVDLRDPLDLIAEGAL